MCLTFEFFLNLLIIFKQIMVIKTRFNSSKCTYVYHEKYGYVLGISNKYMHQIAESSAVCIPLPTYEEFWRCSNCQDNVHCTLLTAHQRGSLMDKTLGLSARRSEFRIPVGGSLQVDAGQSTHFTWMIKAWYSAMGDQGFGSRVAVNTR